MVFSLCGFKLTQLRGGHQLNQGAASKALQKPGFSSRHEVPSTRYLPRAGDDSDGEERSSSLSTGASVSSFTHFVKYSVEDFFFFLKGTICPTFKS